jgi:hypothetical protein
VAGSSCGDRFRIGSARAGIGLTAVVGGKGSAPARLSAPLGSL